jgi:imidazolonepropionase
MKTLLTNISQLVTINAEGTFSKTKTKMSDLSIIENAAMLFSDSIEWIGANTEASQFLSDEITLVDCRSKCVLPGFVDSHTHIVFAGNRANEFAKRLAGVSYQQIASEGGGILSTVRAVRDASVEDIFLNAKAIALSAMSNGTTTIEVKSGYGLSVEDELKLLRAINLLREEVPLRIHSTFLGAHDFPPEYRDDHDAYVQLIINEMIPQVVEEGLAEFCDVFTDTGYYTVKQSRQILEAAQNSGLKLKVHADELSSFCAAELAASMNAISADHLLFISDQGIGDMIASSTVAALLPGTAYTLRLPYAPARKLIDQGAVVALATDCNPGSCYNENMQSIISLACMNMQMSIEEAMTASTLHGASALGSADSVGSLEIGKKADFIILDSAHYADMVYHFGVNHIEQVWIDGKRHV